MPLDRRGCLEYPGASMTRRRKPSHLVAAHTRKVSGEHLDYLRRIDCALLSEKLSGHFGVTRATLAGGGKVDWSFLEASCLDEVSLVVAPVVDGTLEAVYIFEYTCGHEHAPAAPLTLASPESLGEGILWLRCNAEGA